MPRHCNNITGSGGSVTATRVSHRNNCAMITILPFSIVTTFSFPSRMCIYTMPRLNALTYEILRYTRISVQLLF